MVCMNTIIFLANCPLLATNVTNVKKLFASLGIEPRHVLKLLSW